MDFTAPEFKNIKNPRFDVIKVTRYSKVKVEPLSVQDQDGTPLLNPEKEDRSRSAIEQNLPENDILVAADKKDKRLFVQNELEKRIKERHERIKNGRGGQIHPLKVPLITPGEGISISKLGQGELREISISPINPSPAGVYRNMNATVNDKGQVVTAYSGTEGTVTSVTCGEGLNGGIITDKGTISLQENGIGDKFLTDIPSVVKGTYLCPEITVNQKGLVTEIKPGTVLKRIDAGPGLVISFPEPGVVRLDIAPSLNLSGKPTAPTPEPGSCNSQIATTAYTDAAIDAAIQAIVAAMASN